MTEYRLPPLPLGAQHATLLRWLRRAGDSVASDDPLLIVVNDRAEIALAASWAGTLTATCVAEGADIAVGTLLATITPPDASSAAVAQSQPPDSAPKTARRTISPVAQRMIVCAGIDIGDLAGSGVSGRILKADVLAVLATRDTSAADQPQAGQGAAHAAAAPIALTAIKADMGLVAALIERQRDGFARRGIALTYSTCIALAAVAALLRHPLLNSAWDDDRILLWRRVHLSIILGEQHGAALIRDAQDLNLRGLARAITAARNASAAACADSTFTIADTGDRRWGEVPLCSSRQSAALGIGAIRPRPLVITDRGVDRVALRPTALLTLCYDARVLDQRQADAFLREVKERLEGF